MSAPSLPRNSQRLRHKRPNLLRGRHAKAPNGLRQLHSLALLWTQWIHSANRHARHDLSPLDGGRRYCTSGVHKTAQPVHKFNFTHFKPRPSMPGHHLSMLPLIQPPKLWTGQGSVKARNYDRYIEFFLNCIDSLPNDLALTRRSRGPHRQHAYRC